jgi:predicted LPLAT superfamily acyltransferase
MAAVRDVPMLFVAVMKTASKTYHITIRQIESAEQGTSKQKAESLAKQYVKLLETTVLRYPSQWYNYFDFWIK